MLLELKSRIREMNAAKAAKIDYNQRMVTVKDEFQEILTVNEKCDTKKVANRENFNISSSVSKNNAVVKSNVELDLKQAISLVKLGPSVDFMDDAGSES